MNISIRRIAFSVLVIVGTLSIISTVVAGIPPCSEFSECFLALSLPVPGINVSATTPAQVDSTFGLSSTEVASTARSISSVAFFISLIILIILDILELKYIKRLNLRRK